MERSNKGTLYHSGMAWGVHLYTALGVLVGFISLLAIYRERPREAFLWMMLAVIIDGTDGFLARWANVKAVLPHISGDKLDDLVDYLNYVVVPTVLLYQWGFLPNQFGIIVAALPLISSAYGFCQADAKTPDHYFKGFPSYWNIVALYFYLFSSPPWLNTGIIVILSILVFVPLYFVYPSRTPNLRVLTCVLGAIWTVFLVGLILQIPNPSRFLLFISFFFPCYYLILSLVLHYRRQSVSVHTIQG
jgi:phosphatidylcholine synthase